MDWKYILKRVIVGVAIFLIIYFLKAYILLDVHAKELSSTQWGYQYTGIDTNSAAATFDIQGNPWANWGLGKLYFTIAVTKTSGSSTDPVLGVRSIRAVSDSSVYTCTFGANTASNSTWTESTYSVICPMDLGWPGVTMVQILFNPIGQQTLSQYVVTLDGVATFEQDDSVNVNVDTSGTTSAINNQITNDNSNTQSIINNQNSNTEQQIESQKVCQFIDKNNIIEVGQLTASGTVQNSATQFGVTDYINIVGSKIKLLTTFSNTAYSRTCFYNVNKSVISCTTLNSSSQVNDFLTIPTNSQYVRFTIQTTTNIPTFEICKNGNQAIADGQQQINDTLNNDNVDGSTTKGSNFFLDFADHTNPLLDILLFPIRLLDSANDSCSPIPITYLDTTINLPCGDTIFWNRSDVSPFKIWWNLFVGGIAIYYLSLKLFNIVNDSFDPFKDPMNHVGGF